MEISTQTRLKDFSALGAILNDYLAQNPSPYNIQIKESIESACIENRWFTPQSCTFALAGISSWLTLEHLSAWIEPYLFPNSKKIALILAGNIPLVGFHDLLSVLITGNTALVKTSEKDRVLMALIMRLLREINSDYTHKIIEVEDLRNLEFDALIATGSSTSSTYFKKYFERFPSIIRGHRNGIAILNGTETAEEISLLGDDVFNHFGLGCRNVSALYLPVGYELDQLKVLGKKHEHLLQHNKYMNNYQYYKTIFALNQEFYLDFNFFLLRPHAALTAFPSIVHYSYYENLEDLEEQLLSRKDEIQCAVSKIAPSYIPLGRAQNPELTDYSDEINTLAFLSKL